MQGIFTFALVLMVCASPILVAVFLKHYFRYKSETASKLAELDLKLAVNENEILQRRVSNLQKRTEVLEGIITDEGYMLTKEISNLHS